MKIVFWVKGQRGTSCLKKVLDSKHAVNLMVLQPQQNKHWYTEARNLAQKHGIPVMEPVDPNGSEAEKFLKSHEPDLCVLAGYGKILKKNIINIPKLMCINLHGGKLPEYRGSSPMNWALINGETSFGISIIRVDSGVDTGDVLLDRVFPIDQDATIRDLHKKANEAFPEMLMDVLKQIEDGTYALKKQADSKAGYFPPRFPDDGLIIWDMLTAEQIHNRIRALTEPYPCAFTYFNGRKVKLISSEMQNMSFYGEPGRIYLKTGGKLLICASDKCLWITEATFEDNGKHLYDEVSRYERLASVTDIFRQLYKNV